MDFSDFTANDFFLDESFQRWALGKDNENSGWDPWINDNPDKRHLIEEARRLVLCAREVAENIAADDAKEVWSRIVKNIEGERVPVKGSLP